MSDELEFVGLMNPKLLKSIEQEFKEEQTQIIADQKDLLDTGLIAPNWQL